MSLGGTIGDLQKRMGCAEFDIWCAYRHKYGPLNPVRKYDQGLAIVASQINNAHGGKAKPIDFMPYGKEEKAVEINDADEFVAAVGQGVKIGKRR